MEVVDARDPTSLQALSRAPPEWLPRQDFEATEHVRPQFRGELARGFYSRDEDFIEVDEHDRLSAAAPVIRRFSAGQRQRRTLFSYLVIVPFVTMVMIGVATLFAYRSVLMMSLSSTHAILLGVAELDFDSDASSIPALQLEGRGVKVKLASWYVRADTGLMHAFSALACKCSPWRAHSPQVRTQGGGPSTGSAGIHRL